MAAQELQVVALALQAAGLRCQPAHPSALLQVAAPFPLAWSPHGNPAE